MRLFIAAEPARELIDKVIALQDELKPLFPSVKWAPSLNMHITLVFLGECAQQVRAVSALKSVENFGQTHICSGKIAVFPSYAKPGVIYLGIDDKDGSLERMHEIIKKPLISGGFSPEKRKFVPHITLGRIKTISGKEKRDLSAKIKEINARTRPLCFRLKEITLYESVLHSFGPEYCEIMSVNI